MKRLLLWAPLAAFLVLLGLIGSGLLRPSERKLESKLVGKPMPALALPPVLPTHPGLAPAGGPRLVNIFASWCVPCATEVGQLERLRAAGLPVDGIAVRDRPEDLARFLAQNGDPYRAIGGDPQSRSMIALGSSGVPESFIVDARGIIRFHHVGAIGPQDLDAVRRAWRAVR